MEPTIEQWRALYDEAIKIKKQKPWQWMNVGQIFAVEDPFSGINYYCSVQSEPQADFIQMFIGENGLNRMLALADKIDDDDAFFGNSDYVTLAGYMMGFDEESLNCFYTDKDTLIPFERRTIERLELNFRGPKAWISFKKMLPGVVPQAVHSADKVQLMTMLLAQVFKICSLEKKAPFLNNLLNDPNTTEIFWWRYSEEKKRWYSSILKLDDIIEQFPQTVYENQLELYKMRRLRTSQNVFELLRLYLPIPIEHQGQMCYPMAYILMDLDMGHIIWNYMDIYERDHEQRFLAHLIQFFRGEGRKPAKIVTADYISYNIIADFCEKTKIFVEYLDYTLTGDDVIESFLEFTRMQFAGSNLPFIAGDEEDLFALDNLLSEMQNDMPPEEPPKKTKKNSKIIDFPTGKPL